MSTTSYSDERMLGEEDCSEDIRIIMCHYAKYKERASFMGC